MTGRLSVMWGRLINIVVLFSLFAEVTVFAQTTSGVPGTCLFPVSQGAHALFATPISGTQTNQSCQLACLNNPTCVGYEVDLKVGDQFCWLHYGAVITPASLYYDNLQVDFYNVSGGAIGACQSLGATTSFGGVTGLTGVTGASSTFIGSASAGPLSSSAAAAGSTSAFASSVNCGIYTAFPNQNALNGVPQQGVAMASCQSTCNSNPSCVAYEISTISSTACWLHLNPVDLNQLYGTPGVTIYIPSCSSSTVTGPASSGVTVITGFSSSAAATSTIFAGSSTLVAGGSSSIGAASSIALSGSSSGAISGSNCGVYTATQNTNALNAVPQPSITAGQAAQAACQAACTSNPSCVAYEISTISSTACWLHLNPTDLIQLYGTPGVTIYIASCSSSTVTGPASGSTIIAGPSTLIVGGSSSIAAISSSIAPISSTSAAIAGSNCGVYTATQNTNALNAVPQPSITAGQAACQAACTSNPSCVAYEISTISSTACWLHLNPVDLIQLYGTPGVTIFIQTCSASSSIGSFLSSITTNIVSSSAAAGSSAGFTGGQSSSAPFLSSSAAVGSTSSFLSGPNCGIYSATQNANALNGIAAAGVTAANCQSTCTNSPNYCYAYEISTISAVAVCWLHLNPSDTLQLYGTPGVTIYIATCPSSSTVIIASSSAPVVTSGPVSTGAVASSSAPAPTTTVASTSGAAGSTIVTTGVTGAQCVTFTAYAQTQGLNGIPLPTLSAAACQTYCANNPSCVAFEIDTNPQSASLCWIHTNVSDLQPQYYSPTVTQYVASRGACGSGSSSVAVGSTSAAPASTGQASTGTAACATYNSIPQTQSTGGMPQSAITTASACQTLCTNTPSCVAYEIDTSYPQSQAYCWIHTNPSDLNNLYSSSTVTQYQVISRSCSYSATSAAPSSGVTSSCFITWTQINDFNQPGGIPNRATNVNDCQTACIQNLNCIGIDVTNNASVVFFCYLITVYVPLSSFPGNVHYTISRGAGCQTVTTTSAPVTTTITTTPVPVFTGCPNFYVILGYNSDGGQYVNQGMQLYDCINACTQNPLCVAADYAIAGGVCFSHTSQANEQLNSCCYRYDCITTTNCTDAYDSYPNMSPNVALGSLQNGVTTVASCQQACQTYNCTWFSFATASRISTQVCYLFNASTPATLPTVTVQTGMTLYVRKRCVSGSSIPQPIISTPAPLAANYCPYDIVFIVDSSGSMMDNTPPGVNNWQLVLNFTAQIIVSSNLMIGGTGYDHVALVLFSNTAQIVFNFNAYQTQSGLVNAILGLPFIGYTTNTPAAISLAYNLFSDPTMGVRPLGQSSRVAILITDGYVYPVTLYPLYQPAINSLISMNVARFVVGVTTEINMSELLQFVSNQTQTPTTVPTITTVLSFQGLAPATPAVLTFLAAVNCTGGLITGTQLLTLPSSTSTTATTIASITTTAITTTTLSTTTTTSVASSSSAASTSTSTITSLTTSRSTSATTPSPIVAGEGTFSAALRATVIGSNIPVPFTSAITNRNNVYSLTSNMFTSTAANGNYYVEMCAGILASTTAELRNVGAFPVVGFTWLSTAQNGITSGCRGGILQMTRGVSVQLQETGGGVYSDSSLQTSWTIFSVTDTQANSASLLSGTYGNSLNLPGLAIPFSTNVNPPGMYNAASANYLCQTSGTFFFSFSVGVDVNNYAQVQLVGLQNTFELIRAQPNVNTGVTTLARSVIATCNYGFVAVQLVAGAVTPGSSGTNLISFTAFQYGLVGGTSSSWGLYRSTNVSLNTVQTNPLSFDMQTILSGVNLVNNVITIQTGGYYYVYISAGAQPGLAVNMMLQVNFNTVFNVYRTATNLNGLDTLGHGLVLKFNIGDQLSVVCAANTALYSSPGGLHTSFIGMLLYTS